MLRSLVVQADAYEPVSVDAVFIYRGKKQGKSQFLGLDTGFEPEKSAFSGHKLDFSLCNIAAYFSPRQRTEQGPRANFAGKLAR